VSEVAQGQQFAEDWNRFALPAFFVESGPHTLVMDNGDGPDGHNLIDNVAIKQHAATPPSK
jgi:hypothetical protein